MHSIARLAAVPRPITASVPPPVRAPVAIDQFVPRPMPAAAAPMVQLMRGDQELVRRHVLQAGCETRFFPTSAAKPTGVVVYFHGYTAGAWQVQDLQKELDGRGMHVYAPRLPGHGLQRQGKAYPGRLPKSGEAGRYADMAEAEINRASMLAEAEGVPLYVIGLSQGANMAAYVAKRHPTKIKRMVLLAPFLRPLRQREQRWYRRIRPLAWVGATRVLDLVPWSWGPPCDRPRPGHWEFPLGSLFAVLDFGAKTLDEPGAIQTPTQVILTEADPCIDPTAASDLLRTSKAPHFTYTFEKSEAVPHSMLTRFENPNAASLATINHVVGTFFATGEGSNHGPTPATIETPVTGANDDEGSFWDPQSYYPASTPD